MPTNEVFVRQYQALNPEQKKAVDTIEGPVMVLSGPGTGKTQTLAMRIANILQQTQMDPWNILCLTFTESGVAAMRSRLLSIIGTPAYYVRIHTFHSFCNDIIREHPEFFAVSSGLQTLSDVERIELVRDGIDSLSGKSSLRPFGSPYLYLRDASSMIQQLKQEYIRPEDFMELLKKIEKFLGGTKKESKDFFGQKTKERTSAVCEAFYVKLVQAGKQCALPDPLLLVMSRIYETYTNRNAAAEDEKSESKLRTAFKNEIKAWYVKMERQLERQKDMVGVYAYYQKEIVRRGRYDYEDMISMVVEEFQKNDELLAQYQEQFQFILVDEYQDTNGAQNKIVELLGSFDDSPNIFVVGDDKQSIYRFQGASLNNMLSFYDLYRKNISVISLKENYRSQEVVLQAADAVISHNVESISKYIPGIETSLHAASGRSSEMLFYHVFDSEDAEDYAIATYVKGKIEQGAQPGDIAVLFRYNRDGEELLRVMQRLGIPARLEAGENVFDDVSIQQALLFIEYIVDTRREDLLANILQYDWLELPSLDVLKILSHAGRSHIDILQLLGDEAELGRAGVASADQFIAFQKRIADFRAAAVNETLQEFLHRVFEESGWLQFVLRNYDRVSCLQKMTRLLQEAKQLNQIQHELRLQEFMQRLQLLREHDVPLQTEQWQGAENAVHLMTAHKSKGLEFEHVVISRLNNRHWGNNPEPGRLQLPHGFIRYDYIVASENNEDERRLFYVALTRAKQSVWMTRAKHTGSGRSTVPSIFYEEIPASLRDAHEHVEGEQEFIDRSVLGTVRAVPKENKEHVRSWLSSLLQSYILSVTHINNYLECPKKFYIKNVLHVPSVRTPHQALGSAVHGALEFFFAEYEKTGEVPNANVLTSAFDRFLAREVLTKTQAAHAQEVGEDVLQEYWRNYHDSFVRHTKREYNFRNHGVVIDGVPITGLIDKIELLDADAVQKDGSWAKGARVNVVDYKTGNPERGMKKIVQGGDYWRQLVFYKILCDASPRFPYTFATAEIDFIQKSDKKGFLKETIAISDEEVALVREQIASVWKQIQQLAFLEEGAGCGKEDCQYCSYTP